MTGVWRPERRNRRIGTKASGFSKSNDMRIPVTWLDKHGNGSLYFERLEKPSFQRVKVGDNHVKVLFEAPRAGFSYGCSPADIVKLLTALSDLVPALPDIVAFRQPTRKQSQQTPTWGRFLYFAEFAEHHGTAIVVEAQELGAPLNWSKRMTLEDRTEYARLLRDGHVFVETKRDHVAVLTEEAVRNTILYRSFLHELGHLADYHQKVLDDKTALAPNQDAAENLYFSRPASEREAFAHRFAERLRGTLLERGVIPFAPLSFVEADFSQ